MSDEQVTPDMRGVTVEVLATVDLAGEIEGMAGRHLRMRMVTIEPGGVLGPIHDHKGRPGTVYVLQGTITDHRNGVATEYGPGAGWPEDRNTTRPDPVSLTSWLGPGVAVHERQEGSPSHTPMDRAGGRREHRRHAGPARTPDPGRSVRVPDRPHRWPRGRG